MDDDGKERAPDFYDFLENAVSSATVNRKFKSVEAQQWMLHRYETDHGIFNHDKDLSNNYLSLVAQHPTEDTSFGDLLYERLEQYMDARVNHYTGLSFNEFMDNPRHFVQRILERCRARAAKEPQLPPLD